MPPKRKSQSLFIPGDDSENGGNEADEPQVHVHKRGRVAEHATSHGDHSQEEGASARRRSGRSTSTSAAKQKTTDKENLNATAVKLAQLEREAQRLKKTLQLSQQSDDEDQDASALESEEETTNFHNIQFPSASAITPMQTLSVAPTRHLDLARINRKKTPKTSNAVTTPLAAYLSTPSLAEDSDAESNPLSPAPRPSFTSSTSQQRSSGTHVTSTPASNIVPATAPTASTTAPPQNSSVSDTAPSTGDTTTTNSNASDTSTPQLKFADSYNFKTSGPPRARDYDSEGQAIILRAAAYYESKIIGVDCFPSLAIQNGWAEKGFREGCRAAKKNYECSERIKKIIRFRGSRIRGEILGLVHQAILATHNFSSDTTKKAKRQNLDLYEKLTDNMAFAYRDIDNRTGFAENSIFQLILRLVCFNNGSNSRGIIFDRFFNPVSLETLAFFMTEIRHVLEHFSTGIYRKADRRHGFTEQGNKSKYVSYLEALKTWSTLNETVVLKIRKRMYSRAREKSGVDPHLVQVHITEAAKTRMEAELAGRTGDTDSEEDEVEEMREAASTGQPEGEAGALDDEDPGAMSTGN